MAALNKSDFALRRHGDYFKKHLQSLPIPYKTMDTNRLTLLYFSVSGLDLLEMIDEIDKDHVIRYVYSLQSENADHGGFYGYPKQHFGSEEKDRCNNQPHIANTYTALVMLMILGDDIGFVDRKAIAQSLKKWQLPDGSFCCVHGISSLDSENDMRFVYCAATICYILDLWDAIDVDLMFKFIAASQSYDSAFGMGPQTEAHGGCTYCALASLVMMGRLPDLPGKEQLIDWCVKRQLHGFQGRVEKPMDSCYAFWVGASLKLLGVGVFLNSEACAQFLKECESASTGGFQKFPEVKAPDLLHSYFSVCGLSLCGILQPLNPLLGMSERALSAGHGRCRTASGGRTWTPSQAPVVDSLANAPYVQPAALRKSPKPSFERKFFIAAFILLAIAVIFPVFFRGWVGM